MSVEYKRGTAHLRDVVTVEQAESLFEWLQAHRKPRVDLSACTHLHCANLMLLLALRPTIAAMPRDPALAGWIAQSLAQR